MQHVKTLHELALATGFALTEHPLIGLLSVTDRALIKDDGSSNSVKD